MQSNFVEVKTQASIAKEFKQVGKVLSREFSGSQIFLFGSHAYGQPNADSDLDICVILDLADRRKIELMREIRKVLAGVVTVPLDILVYAPEEFKSRANVESTLEHKILTQGIKLNEQQGYRPRMAQNR